MWIISSLQIKTVSHVVMWGLCSGYLLLDSHSPCIIPDSVLRWLQEMGIVLHHDWVLPSFITHSCVRRSVCHYNLSNAEVLECLKLGKYRSMALSSVCRNRDRQMYLHDDHLWNVLFWVVSVIKVHPCSQDDTTDICVSGCYSHMLCLSFSVPGEHDKHDRHEFCLGCMFIVFVRWYMSSTKSQW